MMAAPCKGEENQMPAVRLLNKKRLITLLFIPVAGLLFWLAGLLLTHLTVQQTCNKYAGRIQGITETVHGTLARLALLPATIALDPSVVGTAFAKAVENNPLYITVGLSDAEGSSVFSTYRQKNGTSLSDRRYFRETVQRKSFSAGEFVLGKMSGLGVFHFSLPVMDSLCTLTGTINIAINLQYLGQMLALNELPQGTNLYLVDYRGVILSTNQSPVRRLGDQLSNSDVEWLQGIDRISGGFTKINGSTVYRCGKPLLLEDGTRYAYLMLTQDSFPYIKRSMLLFELLLVLLGVVIFARAVMKKRQAN